MDMPEGTSSHGRQVYRVDHEEAGLDGVRRVCEAVLERVRSDVDRAWIDAFTDAEKLPADVAAALKELIELGTRQHEALASKGGLWRRWRRRRGPSLMGIDLDVRRDEHFAMLKTFGPFSINAEVYGVDWESLLHMHDTGTGVTFLWKPEELTALARLAGVSVDALIGDD